MALTQTHFRFRTDGNAADATPTWGADEDASPNPATTPFRLRLGLKGTSAASGEFELYAQKNAGSYAAVTTSATGGVQSYDASSDADDTALLVPRLTLSAAWWLAGAAIDLDFAGNQIYPSGAFSDYLSCSRASDGYAKNSSGSWVQFTSNELRRTDLGLLCEDARTNYLLNSGSPVTQTTESLGTGSYTLWVEGSGSALASGGTATITGASSATDGSPNTFQVTVAGTVTVTKTGTLDRFQLENGNYASSYIPTAAATAARAQDLISVAGSLLTLVQQNTGSMVFHTGLVPTVDPSGDRFLLRFDAVNHTYNIYGAANERVLHYNGVDLFAVYGGGTNYLTSDTKAGFAWNASGRSVVVNNGTVASDANGNVLETSTPYLGWMLRTYMKRATFWSSKVADATLQGHTVL